MTKITFTKLFSTPALVDEKPIKLSWFFVEFWDVENTQDFFGWTWYHVAFKLVEIGLSHTLNTSYDEYL